MLGINPRLVRCTVRVHGQTRTRHIASAPQPPQPPHFGQGSSSSAGPADEDLTVSFRLFPNFLKSAKLAPHSSPRVPASVSPSTPAAQLEVAPVPDSI